VEGGGDSTFDPTIKYVYMCAYVCVHACCVFVHAVCVRACVLGLI